MDEIKQQKIVEAKKNIISFFIKLDPDKFSDEARKEFARNFKDRKTMNLSARAYDRAKMGNRGGRL